MEKLVSEQLFQQEGTMSHGVLCFQSEPESKEQSRCLAHGTGNTCEHLNHGELTFFFTDVIVKYVLSAFIMRGRNRW